MKASQRETIKGYAFVAPWMAALVFLIGYPFLASLYFSACEYPPLRGPLFVGAENYVELAGDQVFRRSMLVTIIYAVIAIPLGVVLALTLAMFLNARIRGRSIYRVIYYLPHLVPTVVVAILWMWMFNPQFGILNVILAPFAKVAVFFLGAVAQVDTRAPVWTSFVLIAAALAVWGYLGCAPADPPDAAKARALLARRVAFGIVAVAAFLAVAACAEIAWFGGWGPANAVLALLGYVTGLVVAPLGMADARLPGGWALALVILTYVAWRRLARKLAAPHTEPLIRVRGWTVARPSEGRLLLASRVALGVFCFALLLALAAWLRPVDLRKLRSPGWLTDANPFPSGLSVAPSWALWALIYMSMWGVGQMAVIYLAKLQDVPAELYEAADLDGADWWQKTRHVTIPMISPVILFNIVMGIIGAFQVFAEPYIMTNGGPEDRTRFVAMFVYDQAFQYQRLGYASAVAWVLFLVIVALTMLALRLSRERVYYAAR